MLNSILDKSDHQTADGPDGRKSQKSIAIAKIWDKNNDVVILNNSFSPETTINEKALNTLEVRNQRTGGTEIATLLETEMQQPVFKPSITSPLNLKISVH